MQIERERWRGKRCVRENSVKIVKERVIGRGRKGYADLERGGKREKEKK